MRVLVACEFSQIVTKAFRDKGHEAFSCDILPTEGNPDWHIQGDVLEILNDGWDLMIAHPPCTYMSNAGARFMYPKGILNQKRLELALQGKEFFMALLTAPINKICVENPVPCGVIGLPPCNQIIQPYFFGDAVQKKTCLWLKNLPPLMSTVICPFPQSSKIPGNWFNKGGKDRQKNRAKTFPGIAAAMANTWG
jgi:hypothetical protein